MTRLTNKGSDLFRMGNHCYVARSHLYCFSSHAVGEHALRIWRNRLIIGADHVPSRKSLPRGRAHYVRECTETQCLLRRVHDLCFVPVDVGCEMIQIVIFRKPSET